jgi:hypothetical protein
MGNGIRRKNEMGKDIIKRNRMELTGRNHTGKWVVGSVASVVLVGACWMARHRSVLSFLSLWRELKFFVTHFFVSPGGGYF